jgi:hypothetical protein
MHATVVRAHHGHLCLTGRVSRDAIRFPSGDQAGNASILDGV